MTDDASAVPGDEFERTPVPEKSRLGFRSFIGMYAGEHCAGTELMIGPLFVAAEIREIEGRDREVNTLLSLATAIEAEWLRELFPEDLKSELHVQFDATAKRVQAAELLRFRELALAAKRVDPPPAEAAARSGRRLPRRPRLRRRRSPR